MKTATQLEKKTEVDAQQHDLVKGNFSPEDAGDIVNHLISKKINFHEARSFSSEIRFGIKDEHSIQRVKELKETKSALNKIIEQAEQEGSEVAVRCNISIEII